jgi:hypothetical protein
MNKILIYDNSFFVPPDISHLLGVNRFSDVYYRKRSLDQWVSDICAAAGIQFIEIRGEKHPRQNLEQLGMSSTKNLVVMYLPAFIAFGCPEEEAALFLRKLSLTRSSLFTSADLDRPSFEKLQIAVTVGDLAHNLLQAVRTDENLGEILEGAGNQMHYVESDVDMIDMRDPLYFTDYLTSNFDVRFFNSVQTVNDFVVIKRSTETEKLRREFRYYSLLPPSLQMFFIQPYDLSLENGVASYKMERLFVPDMALQWIHGSLDELSFKRFLDKVFYYISVRPAKQVGAEAARAVHRDAYKDKVVARLEQLKSQAEYQKIKPYLEANFDGIDTLFGRYFRLLDRIGDRALVHELRVGHGDLCFSNILYSKTTGLTRFIDPRGADGEEDLYVNPYYDLAKLSHSIIGNYDFINYGLYRLEVGNDLELTLSIHPGAPSWARGMFEDRLRRNGIDPALIRLFEASLFLSMVPLHIDSPKKVLAFLINADKILSELEQT